MKQRKHTKKVLVIDALATPEARAERLRRVRNMANLSREGICDTEQLNINTYKGWEIARYGGLPIDGAGKVVNRITQEGVICSVEWLLYGKGQPPYVMPKEAFINNQSETAKLLPKDIIIKEILVFQNYYPNAFFIEIEDDGMLPIYEPGDFVAGVRKYGTDINSLLDHNCIVQTKSGEKFVRYLRAAELENKFNLLCINHNAKIKSPIIYDMEIEFAALIARHYKVIT